MTGEEQSAAHQYLDFELEIGPGQGREYPVAVLRSPAGEERETMRFPFDQIALENRLDKLRIALLSSSGKYRSYLTPEEQVVKDFGKALFEALLCGKVLTRFEVSKERARQQGRGLRLKLRIGAPELLGLPWEYLFDPGEDDYLCLSRETPVVRYLEIAKPQTPLAVAPPLRILGMCASPAGTPELDIGDEKSRLDKAVAGLQRRGLVEVTWLEGQGWRDLQNALRHGPWHVFHFVGHGRFDRATGEGQLALADEAGRLEPLGAEALARLLGQHRALRLAFLNACAGAQAGPEDPFSSLAAALVRRGLPAAIAMQYPITDRAALELSRAFYEALGDGLPVDAAVGEARLAVSLALKNTLEWGTPVLFMRSPDGEIFHLAPAAADPRPSSAATRQAPQEKPPSEVRLTPAKDAHQIEEAIPDWLKDMGWTPASVESQQAEAASKPVERAARGEAEQAGQPPADAASTRRAEKATPRVVKPEESAPPAEITLDLNGAPLRLVRIPAGEFIMGSDQQHDREAGDLELPQNMLFLPEYYIGRYPVTNRQYRAYVAAVKAAPPYHWTGGRIPGGLEEHPVVNIGWNDAAAFCRWASEVSGQPVRLPSEAEWEKATRGGLQIPRAAGAAELINNPLPMRIYPWGERFDAKLCNTSEGKAGSTTAVGKYSPGGDSPYGCADLAGNVWEWTGSLYQPYPYQPQDGREDLTASGPRVRRGGSFRNDPRYARCACRSRRSPDGRLKLLGFRAGVSPLSPGAENSGALGL